MNHCWTCEHAKEIENSNLSEYIKDFIFCTDGKINCNKLYCCHKHKPRTDNNITPPTKEVKEIWSKWQKEENENV